MMIGDEIASVDALCCFSNVYSLISDLLCCTIHISIIIINQISLLCLLYFFCQIIHHPRSEQNVLSSKIGGKVLVTAVRWASLVLAGFAHITRTRSSLCTLKKEIWVYPKRKYGFTQSGKYMFQGWAGLTSWKAPAILFCFCNNCFYNWGDIFSVFTTIFYHRISMHLACVSKQHIQDGSWWDDLSMSASGRPDTIHGCGKFCWIILIIE